MLLSGENLDNFGDVKNILVEMGTYFQVQVPFHLVGCEFIYYWTTALIRVFSQDDYLDCYGDPEFIGKVSVPVVVVLIPMSMATANRSIAVQAYFICSL